MFKFDLGEKVRDVISGYVGAVVSRTEFLNKCVRYGVTALGLDKDGKVPSTEHFDEEQLTAAGGRVELPAPKTVQTGGPHDPPQRRHDVTR